MLKQRQLKWFHRQIKVQASEEKDAWVGFGWAGWAQLAIALRSDLTQSLDISISIVASI